MGVSALKKVAFRLAEIFLVTPRREIESGLARAAGSSMRLERYISGRGWGIKYLAWPEGAEGPAWVVKAASRLIESRLRRSLKEGYLGHAERFRRECRLLERLEKIGLGPAVLLCEEGFFARQFVAGTCLVQLPPKEISGHVEEVLGAIERMAEAGVFHTDPNAGNVIVRSEGSGCCFVDSEIPGRDDPEGDLSSLRRVYCHERFLHSLSPEKIRLPAIVSGKVMSLAANFFDRMGDESPVPPARAAALVSGNASCVSFPG